MNIALRKGIVDFFKIEITDFVIDTSYKFAINYTDIKIQEGVLFVTEVKPCQFLGCHLQLVFQRDQIRPKWYDRQLEYIFYQWSRLWDTPWYYLS